MVTIDQSVWDYWDGERAAEQEPIWLCVTTDRQVDNPLSRALRAVAACRSHWMHNWRPMGLGVSADVGVSATVQGPLLTITRYKDLRPVLEDLATELTLAGLSDAKLSLAHPDWARVQTETSPAHFLECRFAARGKPGYLPRDRWTVDKTDLRRIINDVTDWCLALPDARRTARIDAGDFTFVAPRDRIDYMLVANTWLATHRLNVRRVEAPVRLVVESGHAFRMAALFPKTAHVSLVSGSTSEAGFDLSRSLDAIREVLADPPAWAEQALVKRGGQVDAVGDKTLTRDWVPVLQSFIEDVAEQRFREKRYVLDAFGMMLLPADRARRIPQMGDWTVSTARDRILVEHRNSQAWFGDVKPDPETLDAARRQLKGVIPPFLDPPLVPPWLQPKRTRSPRKGRS